MRSRLFTEPNPLNLIGVRDYRELFSRENLNWKGNWKYQQATAMRTTGRDTQKNITSQMSSRANKFGTNLRKR